MSGAILRRRDQTNRPLRVDHYSAAVNTGLDDSAFAYYLWKLRFEKGK